MKVKQLIWSEPSPPNSRCSYDNVRSIGALFQYQIEWKSWKEHDSFTLYEDEEFIFAADSLDYAKSFAQSNYERLILSALEA